MAATILLFLPLHYGVQIFPSPYRARPASSVTVHSSLSLVVLCQSWFGQINRNRPAVCPPGGPSVHRETVKQAGTAGALQRLQAATA